MNNTSSELFNTIQCVLNNGNLSKSHIDGLPLIVKDEWHMSYKMDDVLNVHSNLQHNECALQLNSVDFERDKGYDHIDLKLKDDEIHMIFYHRNSLTDTRYYKTNASLRIKTFDKNNLEELREYIEKLE